MIRAGALGILTCLLLASPAHSKPKRPGQPGLSQLEKSKVRQESAYRQGLEAKLAAVNKTQGLLEDKLVVREAEMKQRVRALYKLSRASFPRLWIEAEERRKVAQWLGAARRITTRDQAELRLLHEEMDLANAAEARLRAIENQSLSTVIASRSLQAPLAKTQVVGAYGEYQGPSRKVRLRRRGIELKSRVGEELRALAPGRVVYVGPVSGLGEAVILQHEGYVSLIGRVRPESLAVGDAVPADALLAHAATTRVYLEIRLSVGSVGQTVDPEPLLRK